MGERFTALKNWEWMEGMLTLRRERILEVRKFTVTKDTSKVLWTLDTGDHCALHQIETHWEERWYDVEQERQGQQVVNPPVPDLSDPATRGCLFAHVAELWAIPGLHLGPIPSKADDQEDVTWEWRDWRGGKAFGAEYASLEDALYDAIYLSEARPGQPT
jgi:hypothetical protein